MPPKVKNTHRGLSADDKELHGELFTKAVRGARTMRELRELFNGNTPIPEYHYGSGDTEGVVLTGLQKDFLNRMELTTAGIENSKNFALQTVWEIVDAWPETIEEIGEPKTTDKPLQWSVYDLLRISSIATSYLKMLNHAITWDNRHPQEQSVS